LQPDLALSSIDFQNEKGNIRYGLSSIKGVSTKTFQSMIDFRSDTMSNKFDIFLAAKQAKLGIGVLSSLIQAGILSSFGSNRPRMVLEAQSFNKLSDREKRVMSELGEEYDHDILNIISKEVLERKAVAGDGKPLMSEKRQVTFMAHYAKYKKVYSLNSQHPRFAEWFFEKSCLGYSYSHSLRSVFLNKSENLMNCEESLEAENNEGVKLVGIVESSRKATSKNGNKYYNFKIVDETAKVSALFFEDNEVPKKKDIVIVSGKKAEGDTVFMDSIKILTDKIYMKLSDLK